MVMTRYSSTTGLNLVGTFLKNKEATGRDHKDTLPFRAVGKGVDRKGDPIYNDFTIVGVNPVKSNIGFSTVDALTHTGRVELHMLHNARYLVPVGE